MSADAVEEYEIRWFGKELTWTDPDPTIDVAIHLAIFNYSVSVADATDWVFFPGSLRIQISEDGNPCWYAQAIHDPEGRKSDVRHLVAEYHESPALAEFGITP